MHRPYLGQQTPPYRTSIGFFGGTNIIFDEFLDEFVFGIEINRLVQGMPNLLIGLSWYSTDDGRNIGWFLGTGLEL